MVANHDRVALEVAPQDVADVRARAPGHPSGSPSIWLKSQS
jgi:hypothetical protein